MSYQLLHPAPGDACVVTALRPESSAKVRRRHRDIDASSSRRERLETDLSAWDRPHHQTRPLDEREAVVDGVKDAKRLEAVVRIPLRLVQPIEIEVMHGRRRVVAAHERIGRALHDDDVATDETLHEALHKARFAGAKWATQAHDQWRHEPPCKLAGKGTRAGSRRRRRRPRDERR